MFVIEVILYQLYSNMDVALEFTITIKDHPFPIMNMANRTFKVAELTKNLLMLRR